MSRIPRSRRMTGLRHEVLALYRRALRVARALPAVPSVARKLRYNARELILLRRREPSVTRVRRLLREGSDALDVFELLAADRALLAAISRKPGAQ